jgi:hypothetical protein
MPEYLVQFRKRKNGPLHEVYFNECENPDEARQLFRRYAMVYNSDWIAQRIFLNVWEA